MTRFVPMTQLCNGGNDEIDEDEYVDMMGIVHIIGNFFVIYVCI